MLRGRTETQKEHTVYSFCIFCIFYSIQEITCFRNQDGVIYPWGSTGTSRILRWVLVAECVPLLHSHEVACTVVICVFSINMLCFYTRHTVWLKYCFMSKLCNLDIGDCLIFFSTAKLSRAFISGIKYMALKGSQSCNPLHLSSV